MTDGKILSAMEVVAKKVLQKESDRFIGMVSGLRERIIDIQVRLTRLEQELPPKCDSCGRRG